MKRELGKAAHHGFAALLCRMYSHTFFSQIFYRKLLW
jgi:hypothetical protein